MENYNGENYPQCIKNLLIASGYSKFTSLAEIDDAKIGQIEDHINKNSSLVANLKCCYSGEYKKQTIFHFLPGHKAAIVGIKNKVMEMKDKGLLTLKTRKRSTQPKARSQEELKTSLIKALNTFFGKYSLPNNIFTERNILDFQTTVENEMDVHKCRISCVFCPKKYNAIYKGYWMTSNATKHLKNHILSGTVVTDQEEENSFEDEEMVEYLDVSVSEEYDENKL